MNEPHLHTQITEIYLVAQGTAQVRVEQRTLPIQAGDMLVIEAGEAHTFIDSSPEYFHFVIHVPGLSGEIARTEKVSITTDRLGL